MFEENPFTFCERHRIVAGKRCPLGFRAVWADRDKLAMAKLVEKLRPDTEPKDYPSILLNQASSSADSDFIECHIYGAVHPSSVERVVGLRPKTKHDLIIWKSAANALRKAGVIVEEV